MLAPRRGLFATVESKSKNNSKNAESKTREYSWNCQTSTASPAVGHQTYGLDNKVRNRHRGLRLSWNGLARWQLRPLAH